MITKKEFSKYENANAILNGQEDCCDEFVEGFVDLHKQPIDNHYMYEWLLRSLIDVVKTNHSVLYIACGTAGYSKLFKNVKRFLGIDFSKKMIQAARQLNKMPNINFEFQCTTFENFVSDELFDVIYLGPYGNNVPYTFVALEKAKKYLQADGMVFCAIPDPELNGVWARSKELLKQLIYSKNIEYDPIQKLEKMLKKSRLEIYLKLRMKTSVGYSFCYIAKKI